MIRINDNKYKRIIFISFTTIAIDIDIKHNFLLTLHIADSSSNEIDNDQYTTIPHNRNETDILTVL